ncbi:ElaB protein [Burkholderia multivorans]
MALTDTVEYKLDRGLSEVRRTGRHVARTTRTAATDIHADLRALVDELEALLKRDGDGGGDTATLQQRVQDRLADARRSLDQASHAATGKVRDSAGRVSQAVRDNPWKTAGVVAGLALVAGALLSRR